MQSLALLSKMAVVNGDRREAITSGLVLVLAAWRNRTPGRPPASMKLARLDQAAERQGVDH